MATRLHSIEFWLQLLTSKKHGKQNAFKLCVFKKGQAVYRQDSPAAGVYFIKSGKVKMKLSAEDKEPRIIHIGMESDFFGYKDMIAGRKKYSNTVKALEDVQLFFIPKNVFIDVLNNHPKELWAFSVMLGNDLLEIENNMVGFNCKPVKKGVAHTLLWLDKYFKLSSGGTVIPLSRTEFAHTVGTATETVIRILSEFKRKKLISLKGGKIGIVNRRGLQNIIKGRK